jgi:hypothetical protein
MDDTPEHVKQKQLEIWLSKSPEERIRLTLQMNDELFAFWQEGRKSTGAPPLVINPSENNEP